MFLRFWIIVGGLLLVASGAFAADLNGECRVRFFGTSTLHDFSGQAVCEAFNWSQSPAAGGELVVQDALVRVPVAAMDTDNGKRDKKMYEMFSSAEFPLIEGRFEDFVPQQLIQQLRSDGEEPGRLPFELRIRDISRPVEAVIRELRETPQEIFFVAEFPVSLAAYDLKAPGVLGIIRVGDEVRVEVEVVIRSTDLPVAATGTHN